MSTKSLFKNVALQVASVVPKAVLGPKGLAIQAAIAVGASAMAPQEAQATDAQTIGGIAGTIIGAAAGKKIGDGSTTNAVIGGILGGTVGSQMGRSVDNAEKVRNGELPPPGYGQVYQTRPYGSYAAPYPSGYNSFNGPSTASAGYGRSYQSRAGYYPVYDNRAPVYQGPSTASAGFGQPARSNNGNGQAIGTVGGAVAGGLIGRALGGSNAGPAAVAGAILGGIAGNAVGKASDTNNAPVYQVRQVPGQVFYPQGVPLRIVNPGNLPADMYTKLSTMYQSAANLRATAERSHFEWQQAKIDASLSPGNSQANAAAETLRQRLNDDINALNRSYADATNASSTIRRAGYEPGDQFLQIEQQLRAPMARNSYQFIDSNGYARQNTGFQQGVVRSYGDIHQSGQPFRQVQAVNSVPQY